MSSISSVSKTPPPDVQKALTKTVDSDGDNAMTQSKKLEAKETAPKPVSETIGNNINTTA